MVLAANHIRLSAFPSSVTPGTRPAEDLKSWAGTLNFYLLSESHEACWCRWGTSEGVGSAKNNFNGRCGGITWWGENFGKRNGKNSHVEVSEDLI